MATKPGLLTEWPWKALGSFKYIILAPWAMHSLYSLATKGKNELDYTNLLILPFLLSRALHNQIWISISRHRTAQGKNRIVDRGIEFEQVDRESNWDDQILLSGIMLYIFNYTLSAASFSPAWRTDGVIITALLHAGPVEYIYYWLHRALHHHYLYSRYHSHHHSSIVTEPISSVIHPFAEHIAYFLLFAIPLLGTLFNGTASLASLFGYITYIDLMNNMGHCNFEFIPKWPFSIFPPLKYFMYTPSFHSLHHTQFRSNYSLFMPLYDYIHGTTDKSTDALYESSLERRPESPDVVHLTHLTTPESVFHLPVGFASFASRPQESKSSTWFMWPLSWLSAALNFVYGRTFLVERNLLGKLKLHTWTIPRYTIQYALKWQRQGINVLIEEAIIEADARGSKVISLGLLNQSEELNRSGGIFIERYPKLKTKVVDGSSLAVAIVLNRIPKGTTEILFRGALSKLALAIVSALSHNGIQVWLVGDGLSKDEQLKAPKGTLFIPFSHFPPKKARDDVFYCHTPSMIAPPSLQNLHSCENWLPRRAMSAARVAGILHALEGWDVHECGASVFDADKIWEAAIKHGFRPTTISK
ncbi:very-long-chain aldehyde decarbonylase CER1-like isoform X2 [Salvia miltiorrhiza]|uniref:very-long-chain aldehyde decarbonylase CER1-like isoform X2 n=1 Tax=Salvia miltiorrhiza TaxID=226208 RepID=UPI0025AD02CD|nr:very-long-chain aldehyde decarbonylase CER1-like isoform X2 [Salvia miltiorrhiza]